MTLILSEVDPDKGKTHISSTSSGVNVILFNLQGQEEKAKPQPGGGGRGVRISNAIPRLWVSVLCLSFYELSGPCFIRLAVGTGDVGCLPFDRKIRLGCRRHNGKRFTSLP